MPLSAKRKGTIATDCARIDDLSASITDLAEAAAKQFGKLPTAEKFFDVLSDTFAAAGLLPSGDSYKEKAARRIFAADESVRAKLAAEDMRSITVLEDSCDRYRPIIAKLGLTPEDLPALVDLVEHIGPASGKFGSLRGLRKRYREALGDPSTIRAAFVARRAQLKAQAVAATEKRVGEAEAQRDRVVAISSEIPATAPDTPDDDGEVTEPAASEPDAAE